jgi:glycosyltransferase involved in cell wall biosynthesis
MGIPEVSIVIPVHNEEESITILGDRIRESMSGDAGSYEVVFVDDGSTDRTYAILKGMHEHDRRVRVIKFRSNYGQSAAMAAGFKYARGKFIVSMDGDLQNDPRDISAMLSQLDGSCDMICGWRKHRKDKLILRKVPSKIANYIIRAITKVKIHDTGCSLRVYRAEVAKRICLHGELHRFIPALAKIEGARIREVVVEHHSRKYGRSKYSIARTVKVLMDMTTMSMFIRYLWNPLKYFGIMALFFLFSGALAAGIYTFSFVYGTMTRDELNLIATLIFLFFASGIQYVIYGFLAEIISHTSDYVMTRK